MGLPAAAATAMLKCSFGMSPAPLLVLPTNRVISEGKPQANIGDSKPLVNITPFGMCTSPANPTVAAATSAALGVLTPMPCLPATAAPWAPGSPRSFIGQMPALVQGSVCNCNWGGVITIVTPGTTRVTAG